MTTFALKAPSEYTFKISRERLPAGFASDRATLEELERQRFEACMKAYKGNGDYTEANALSDRIRKLYPKVPLLHKVGERVEYTAGGSGRKVEGYIIEIDQTQHLVLVKPDSTLYKEEVWLADRMVKTTKGDK